MSDLDLSAFAARLTDVTRDNRQLLENLFRSAVVRTDTLRNIRVHVLKSDGNGRPQVKTLVGALSAAILDYCLPRHQIVRALDHQHRTNSTQRILALASDAKSLFTDIAKSGEGGELLLYVLTESVLKYPQALSKMALKTNPRMHFHGTDGVYISCAGAPPKLRIHFGESKLHRDPISAIQSAIASIAAILHDSGFRNAARQDYFLLNNHLDLGETDLDDALTAFLDPNDARYRSPEVCAVLLAGHDVTDYPQVHDEDPIPATLLDRCTHLAAALETSAESHAIDAFLLDVFFVPFPSVEAFRSDLFTELGLSSNGSQQDSQ